MEEKYILLLIKKKKKKTKQTKGIKIGKLTKFGFQAEKRVERSL